MAYNHRKIHYGWAFYHPTTQNHLQIYVIFYNTARKEPHFYIVYVKPDEQLEYSTMARNCTFKNYEGHYQQMLYVIFSLLGRYVDVEVRTATGRVDMVMQAFGKLYLFELKLNRSAAAAMQQINLNDYPARFSQCGLPIVKVGINFDTATRTLSDWVIE